jgi:hypothetical protein
MSSNSPAPIPGTLHVYDPSERLVYFESMPSSTSSAGCSSVIFIGGLGDGLAATPYLPPLAEALHGQGWSLIEVLTRSSYTGWGMGSVDRDVEDLHKLEGYLRRKDVKGGEAKLVLLGHSTGTWLQHHSVRARLKLIYTLNQAARTLYDTTRSIRRILGLHASYKPESRIVKPGQRI